MRHGIKGKKLNRNSSHRQAMMANMASSLIMHEQITTTLPKAKNIKPYLEKLVTASKREQTLAVYRRLLAELPDEESAKKLFFELGPRYLERPGGYLRIIKAGYRKGDSAPIAVIEFVDRDIHAKGKIDREKLAKESKKSETE